MPKPWTPGTDAMNSVNAPNANGPTWTPRPNALNSANAPTGPTWTPGLNAMNSDPCYPITTQTANHESALQTPN